MFIYIVLFLSNNTSLHRFWCGEKFVTQQGFVLETQVDRLVQVRWSLLMFFSACSNLNNTCVLCREFFVHNYKQQMKTMIPKEGDIFIICRPSSYSWKYCLLCLSSSHAHTHSHGDNHITQPVVTGSFYTLNKNMYDVLVNSYLEPLVY